MTQFSNFICIFGFQCTCKWCKFVTHEQSFSFLLNFRNNHCFWFIISLFCFFIDYLTFHSCNMKLTTFRPARHHYQIFQGEGFKFTHITTPLHYGIDIIRMNMNLKFFIFFPLICRFTFFSKCSWILNNYFEFLL